MQFLDHLMLAGAQFGIELVESLWTALLAMLLAREQTELSPWFRSLVLSLWVVGVAWRFGVAVGRGWQLAGSAPLVCF